MKYNHYEIITPEQVKVEYELAGIGRRGIALIADFLLEYIIMLLLILAYVTLESAGILMPYVSERYFYVVIIVISTLYFFLYHFLFEWLTHGYTPGKKLMGVRVIRLNGRPLGFVGAFLRNLLRLVEVPLLGVGMIFMFADKWSRRAGDLVAGTVTVCVASRKKLKKISKASDLYIAPDTEAAGRMTRYPITPEEFSIVRDFLMRKNKISGREALAASLGARFFDRFGIPPNDRRDPVGFLTMLYEENRD